MNLPRWRNSGAERRVLVAAMLFLSVGLGDSSNVQVGRDVDANAFESHIHAGTSRQADVESWLGTPHGRGVNVEAAGHRPQKWTYYYFGQGRLPTMDNAHLKLLEVQFDQDGLVQAYNWTR